MANGSESEDPNFFKVGDIIQYKKKALYAMPSFDKSTPEKVYVVKCVQGISAFILDGDDHGIICSCRRHCWQVRQSEVVKIGNVPRSDSWNFTWSHYAHGDWNRMLMFDDAFIRSCQSIKKPKKTLMESISLIAKKLLDSDFKTLIEAGFMNSDLTLTSDGHNQLEAILFETNKAALVADAKARIEERKK